MTEQVIFNIERLYVKDASIEQPNSPAILLEGNKQPSVEMELNIESENVKDDLFEISVTANIHTKAEDKTLFLVEVSQAGLFQIKNIPKEQMQGVLRVSCPQIIYPYLRSNVSDLIVRAGFPPIHMTEINFQAMFENQKNKENKQQSDA